MKKFLLFFIMLIISFGTVRAEITLYNRESRENYGVNKKWNVGANNIDNVKATPLVDSSIRIYDLGEILSDEEEEEIYKIVQEYEEKTGFTFVFLSVDEPFVNYIYNDILATDFYDYNDFGINDKYYSGVLLYRNASLNYAYYGIYFFGEAQLYYDDDRMNNILDGVYSDFYNHNYMDGINYVFDKLNNYYDKGIPYELSKSYIDSYGNVVYVDFFKPPWILALIISLIVTALFVSYHVNKHKTVFKITNAADYLDHQSINYSYINNQFIRSHTVTRARSSNYNGSGRSSFGSSGGSRSGSSGGGFRGGGRRG